MRSLEHFFANVHNYDNKLNFLYDRALGKSKLTVDTVIFLFQLIQYFFAVASTYERFSAIPHSQNINAKI